MDHEAENEKLVSLRARTDRELAALIRRDLEMGLNLAQQAGCDDKMTARRVWAEARRLLPHVTGMSDAERREFTKQLERLRRALDVSCRLHAAGA